MSDPSEARLASLPLRERKKLRTHIAIQGEAMRLFREQGYEATTVEQICAAAEVSMSTFFRYFANKEEVVLHDALDPLVLVAFESQPPELGPVEAWRRATREVIARLSAEELAEEEQRQALIRSTPALQAAWLRDLAGVLEIAVAALARRTGRAPDDVALLTVAGAAIGVAVAIWVTHPSATIAEYLELLDAGLTRLETGVSLQQEGGGGLGRVERSPTA